MNKIVSYTHTRTHAHINTHTYTHTQYILGLVSVMRVDVTYVRIIWCSEVRGSLTCKSDHVLYLISCKKFKKQCVGSAFESDFKPRFRVYKGHINTGKGRCRVAKHFLNICTGINKLEKLEVQLIEEVRKANYDLKVSFGQERNIGKPSYLLLHMV